MSILDSLVAKVEKGSVPDFLVRLGIRALLIQRLAMERKGSCEKYQSALMDYVAMLKASPLAVLTDKANEQHYEVPAAFFQGVMGAHMKYSSCLFPVGVKDLTSAEEHMLRLTTQRAELKDGMDILELGCGWGSLSLWMAKNFPNSKIVGVSNSSSQRSYILDQARERGLNNLEIRTCDMNEFDPGQSFDRVVSVEMFEHMRNYELLLSRISTWLKPAGKLFVHIFTHKQFAYLFETEGASNWMGRYFFSGGMMPSDSLLLYFQKDLEIERHWRVNGTHYAKTAEAWAANLENKRDSMMPILASIYGEEEKKRWFMRWKLFFLACAELFNFRRGNEWFVSHYLFARKS